MKLFSHHDTDSSHCRQPAEEQVQAIALLLDDSECMADGPHTEIASVDILWMTCSRNFAQL